jgi:hypothetical protein
MEEPKPTEAKKPICFLGKLFVFFVVFFLDALGSDWDGWIGQNDVGAASCESHGHEKDSSLCDQLGSCRSRAAVSGQH